MDTDQNDIQPKHSSLIELVLLFISLSFLLIIYFSTNKSNTKPQSMINNTSSLEDDKKV